MTDSSWLFPRNFGLFLSQSFRYKMKQRNSQTGFPEVTGKNESYQGTNGRARKYGYSWEG